METRHKDTYTHTTCESHFSYKDTQTKRERMEKRYSMKMKRQLGWQESNKIDCKTKTVTRDKKGYYIITGSVQQEDIIVVNICSPIIGTSEYIQKILINIKGEIDSNTVIVRDFNIPLTSKDRSSRRLKSYQSSFSTTML